MSTLGYYDVLNKIHETLYPRNYLEVGVSHGTSIALVLPGTVAIGVDPSPNVMSALSEDTIMEICTSDEFFESGRLPRHLGGSSLDLSFIDGMHLWEFVLRDFLNVERHSHSGSVVLIHDCLPRNAVQAERKQPPGAWTGDVWKLLFYLREERPDLDIAILDSPPTGLGLIRNLNPNRPDVDVTSVIDQYMDLDFEIFESDLLPSMRVVSGDWSEVRALLPEQPWQPVDDVSSLIVDRAERQPTLATRWRRRKYAALKSAPVKAALRCRHSLLKALRFR